ncbi:hypothetical protein C8R43DRAFT_1009402 [Mycena crocata]|nr:hypothetical protein C8R43DRAFT_1009402 [Mycena crocata]
MDWLTRYLVLVSLALLDFVADSCRFARASLVRTRLTYRFLALEFFVSLFASILPLACYPPRSLFAARSVPYIRCVCTPYLTWIA